MTRKHGPAALRVLFLTFALCSSTNCERLEPRETLHTAGETSPLDAIGRDQTETEPREDPATPRWEKEILVLQRGSNFASLLQSQNIDAGEAARLAQTLNQHIPVRNLRAGTEFTFASDRSTGLLMEVSLDTSATESLHILRKSDNTGWVTAKHVKEIQHVKRLFSGTVSASLWQSAENAGLDSSLISQMAQILGWQIDLSREVQVGDRWKILTSEKKVEGERVDWGPILALEYMRGGESYIGIRHVHAATGDASYYDEQGENLKGLFLRSPIDFARITSGFNRQRFHPVLKVRRPHNGIDYAARPGTPVKTVGKGKVTLAGRMGGCGNTVKVQHNTDYVTVYCHLKGFAPGIRSGTRVKQGQVIGYVGSTGLATGPHLHFEFRERGRYVDPQGKRFPRQAPLKGDELARFKQESQILLADLARAPSTMQIASDEQAPPESPVN